MPLFSRVSSLLKSGKPELPFEYQLERSARRRSITITISKGAVVVRAPFFVAKVDIEKFVQHKSLWVQEKLALQIEQLESIPKRSYVAGSCLPFLGRSLSLQIARQPQADVVLTNEVLQVSISSRSRLPQEEQVKRLVAKWYQDYALYLLTAKTNKLVQQLGLTYLGVAVRATRSKWGHCTPQGAIQYNWQILLAPEPIVDYLVAHEVSHLVHHNHSPAFWQLVSELCPEYKKYRSWLKSQGFELVL
jgi:predicted metal-dependent hydrolase